MPSSVAADDDRGGEGVDERKDDAPELESTEGGRSLPVPLPAAATTEECT